MENLCWVSCTRQKFYTTSTVKPVRNMEVGAIMLFPPSKWICFTSLPLSSRCPDTKRLLITFSRGKSKFPSVSFGQWPTGWHALRMYGNAACLHSCFPHAKCNHINHVLKFTGFNTTAVTKTHIFLKKGCHSCIKTIYILFTMAWLKGMLLLLLE